MIEIEVNGEQTELAHGLTISDFLANIGVDTGKVAVERNLEIIPRSQYQHIEIMAGDKLEIVHFIGGG